MRQVNYVMVKDKKSQLVGLACEFMEICCNVRASKSMSMEKVKI